MKYLVLFFSAVLFSSCSESTTANNSSSPPNDTTFLLTHSRFEQNGNPSLNGWNFHRAQEDDTIDFERDAPPTGGTWSFKLHTSDTLASTNYITQTFTNLGSGVYELTAWTKMKYALAPGSFPPGWISLIKVHAGDSTVERIIAADSSMWNLATLFDTLTLQPTDSLTVMLSAGARRANDFTQHGNPMWVDDITLVKLP